MARMIERWFPCDDVTERSQKGWGGGLSENGLFPWFASRPPAQAKAAVICSLLEWPEDDPDAQNRMKALVKSTMQGYNAAHAEITAEIRKHVGENASVVDPFSGRAIIPAEAARLSVKAHGIDYSPVATLAGTLLADWPLRNWSHEPELPFSASRESAPRSDPADLTGSGRLLIDTAAALEWVGKRHRESMAEFYPIPEPGNTNNADKRTPWAYLWAVTIPCVQCGGTFPLTANLKLRNPNPKKNDKGQPYRLITDASAKTIRTEVHDGKPVSTPTLEKIPGKGQGRGKAAVCPFCWHIHTFNEHTRMRGDGLAGDMLLVVAEISARGTPKRYRTPAVEEVEAAEKARIALEREPDFAPGLPAVPHESSANSYAGPRPLRKYGYKTFGDFCNPRQTLSFVRLARAINELYDYLITHGVSNDYAQALSGYASSVLTRILRRSTRGAILDVSRQHASDIASAGPVVPMGNDYVEAGPYTGPATWESISKSTLATLRRILGRERGLSATINRGTAQFLPHRSESVTAVVTDPPYDTMVQYSDSSDLYYVWMKRAMCAAQPELLLTADQGGLQEKEHEAIVVMGYNRRCDHRTPSHYDKQIAAAFTEAKRIVTKTGVVTIIFGHDDPDVWKRLLLAVNKAGLVLTGSWPARTETGAQLNKANIEVTLTLVCRPARPDRLPG